MFKAGEVLNVDAGILVHKLFHLAALQVDMTFLNLNLPRGCATWVSRLTCGVRVRPPSSPHPHRASADRAGRRGRGRRVRRAW